MRQGCGAILLCAAACGADPQLIAPSMPEGVDLVGLIAERFGEAASATGLVPFGERADLSLEAEEGDTIHLFGFSRSDLGRSVDLPAETELARIALDWAELRSPVLPDPLFHAESPFPVGKLRPTEPGRRLTAGWLPRCPELFPERAPVFAECEALCGGHILQSECSLDLSAICLSSAESWSVDGRGRLVAEGSEVLGDCAPTEPRPFETGAYACESRLSDRASCRVGLVDPARGVAFDVAEANLYEGLDAVGDQSAPVILGDEVVVLRYPEGPFPPQLESLPSAFPPSGCRAPALTELVFFDTESLQVSRVVRAPDCLYRLTPDPVTGGFWGLLTENGTGENRVLHFTRSGTVTASQALPSYELGLPTRIASWERHVLVLFSQSSAATRSGSPVVLLDRQNLEVLEITTFDGVESQKRDLTGLASLGSGRFAFPDKRLDGVAFFDVASGHLELEKEIPFSTVAGCETQKVKLRNPGFDPRSRALLVGSGGVNPIFLALFDEAPPRCVRGAPYDPPTGEPHEYVPWGSDPDLVFAMLFTDDEHSVGMLFNVGEGFVLPGAFDFGPGFPRAPRADDRGRVWVSVLGSGKLFRVSPR